MADMLARSNDQETRKEALTNTRIALCADRYSRQAMVDALLRSNFSRSAECIRLIGETEVLCKPPDCDGRTKPMSVCRTHADIHGVTMYRHCDENENIIHLMVSTCSSCFTTKFI